MALKGEAAFDRKMKSLETEIENVILKAQAKGSILVRNDIVSNLSGKVLKVRSNALRSSVKILRPVKSKGAISLRVTVGTKHARIHEYGGTIKGKPWLTIPLPTITKGASSKHKKKARSYKDTFIRKSKRGNLIIFQNRTRKTKGKNRKSRSIRPLFVLKKKVKIKKTRFAGMAVEKNRFKILTMMRRAVKGLMDAK